nr:uncharacterized protein [Tanacetum cinerariifolium]
VTNARNITMIKDVDSMLDNITVQGRCISLWHLHRLNEAHNPYILDMVLQDSQNVVPVQSATGRKIQRTVVIKDSESNQLDCILWDHWVNMWDEYAQKRNELGHIIFILQLGKVKSWDGTPSIHNALFGTKMFINRDFPEIQAFRQRFKELPEYDENQFKIFVFTPQKPVVTSASFIENIRRYNSMFAFTSMGDGKPAMFAQLYIFDTENEIQNRIGAVSNGESSSSRNNELDYQLTTDIRDLLDEINPLADEHIRSSDDEKISLRLIVTRQRDGRQYNLPTASEVAALIIGDFDSTEHKRDIILHCQDGDFKRISELHPSYLALHYPLFFPYGEDNYRSDIFHEGQFIVDAYTMIKSERLTFNRKNDKDLRSETYSKLATLAHNSESGLKLRGKKKVDQTLVNLIPQGLDYQKAFLLSEVLISDFQKDTPYKSVEGEYAVLSSLNTPYCLEEQICRLDSKNNTLSRVEI